MDNSDEKGLVSGSPFIKHFTVVNSLQLHSQQLQAIMQLLCKYCILSRNQWNILNVKNVMVVNIAGSE
jgi:hypothetical protein